MPKFYKLMAGKKFYCDEKGVLAQKDGENVAVPDTDTAAVDVESGVDEATKMLSQAMQKAIEEGDKAAVASLQKAQEAVEKWFEAVEEKAKGRASKVEKVEYKASFNVEEVLTGIKELAAKGRETFSFSVRDVKDLEIISKSNSRGDNTGDVILPVRDPEITRDPVRAIFLEQIADTVEIDGDYVSWVEVTGATGAPASTAELGTIPEKDYAFQEFRKPVEKVTVMNKHSVELLKHGPSLVAAIKGWLNQDLNVVVDQLLLTGTGTTPQIQGIVGVAEVLDATAIGSQVVANANLFDVLRIAATKILVAGKGKFIPNYVLLNPADSEELDLTKNADGDYILPAFYAADGMKIKGARVIENTGVTAGSFVMGDFRYLHVRPKGGVEIEMTNSDGTDFKSDILSVKLRRWLTAYVRNNDSAAFITGDISDIKAALAA
jgi:hypothetical protein